MNKFLGLFLLTSCQVTLPQSLEDADDAWAKGQYQEADKLYRQSLEKAENKEDGVLVLLRLAELNAWYLHNNQQALADYSLVAKLKPLSPQAFNAKLAMAELYHKEQPEEAIALYRELISNYPSRPEIPEVYFKLAESLFLQGNYAQVPDEAQAMLVRFPQSAETFRVGLFAAKALYVQGHIEEALAMYQELLNQSVDEEQQATLQFELGNCFAAMDDLPKALVAYQAALPFFNEPQIVQNKLRQTQLRARKTWRLPQARINSERGSK